MREVTDPIIAIALVLVAVFVPLAFISGLSGQFYKQFAMTIAISTVISAINSLTLSPALAALAARSRHDGRKTNWFFRGFNRYFGRASDGYSRGVGARAFAQDGDDRRLSAFFFLRPESFSRRCRSGFVPQQDKQYLIGFAQLPDGATLDRTEDVMRRMGEIMLKQPGVENAVGFPGLSINGFTNSSNAGIVFAALQDFDQRKSPELERRRHRRAAQRAVRRHPGRVHRHLPAAAGARAGHHRRASSCTSRTAPRSATRRSTQATKAFMAKAYQSPELAGMFSTYQVNVPQLYADIDRTKARQLGVPVTEVFDTMQIYLGSLYVNDFNKFGRTYSVRVQADAPYRARAEDVGPAQGALQHRRDGAAFRADERAADAAGPERAMRYNGFLAADINGSAAPGYSSGQAQDAIERIAAETLPPGIGYEWTEITYQEILAGNSATWVYPLAIFLVFLVLAALYESLALPIAIILDRARSSLGAALTGVWLTNGDNNIFTQIGFMVLVGLAAKNAILIVEFARELEFAGRTPVQAAIEASRLRLRPIIMTSIAFIMGVVPLAFSVGAGAEMRQAMGIAVFAGMIGVTAFGIFLTPVFYVLLRALTGNRPLKHHGEAPALASGGVSLKPPTDEGHRMKKRGLSLIFVLLAGCATSLPHDRRRQAAAPSRRRSSRRRWTAGRARPKRSRAANGGRRSTTRCSTG